MKIKYCPCRWNEYAKDNFPDGTLADTIIIVKDENTISIDGKDYQFDTDSVVWDDIATQTNGVITNAYRTNGVLCLTVRRFYTDSCVDWDTGDYHDIEG